jgi:hypothetical protein
MSKEEPQVQNLILERFFEQLTWAALEKRIRAALKNPKEAVPLEINCPAVMDLARQILGGIGESAIQRPGQPVSEAEVFNYDQRLAVLRILEAIISEYEEWKLRHLNAGGEVLSVRFNKTAVDRIQLPESKDRP